MDGGGGPRWKSSVRAAGGRRSGSPVAPCVRLLVHASAGIPSGGETRFAGLTASQTPDPAFRDARYRHIRPHARRVTQPSFRRGPRPRPVLSALYRPPIRVVSRGLPFNTRVLYSRWYRWCAESEG